MRKNVAGQRIGAQLVSATDGSAFTGSVTVAVTVDAGTQATGSVGSGACTHEGGGYHTYAPAQAETNGDLVAFTFSGTGAVPVTIQVYTRPATGLLAPTVADRTLDVSSTGEAGIDWANVGSPTTTNVLSGTTISSSQAVASVTGAVGSVTGNVGGNVTGNVSGSVGSVVGNVGGNVTGSIGSVAANGITASSIATAAITAAKFGAGAIDASALAADAVAEIADGVWDESISGHLTAGSTGNALNAAGSAGDPWSTTLPGSYTGSQAGKMLSDILVDTGTTLQAELDGIQADTEDIQSRLPSALVGGRIDATVDGTGMEAGATAAIADAVWDELLGGHVVAGSAAVILGDGAADAGEAREKSSFIWDDLENGGRIDLLVDAIKATTDKLDTAMVLDGAVWQFTVNALELAPAGGGGGSTDWNADERTAIRAILGIPGSGTTPADPTTGILDTIRDLVVTVDNVADGIATQVGTAGNGLTSIPWNAAWDAEVQSECADALNAYDPPTNAEMEARTLTSASYGTSANQTTILARLGSWTGSGINTVLGAFRALMAKASALTPTDISSSTTYDNTTDSLEALRDRGDAAWTTGSGGGGSSQAVIGSTNAITRNINEELPIQFTWNSASATITGTVEIGTASAVALQGAITFVRTDAAGKHWYQLAYDADDRPTVAGLARYVFTDGTDFLTVPVQFTEVASGGGLPFAGAVADRVEGTKLQAFYKENTPISIAVTDASGNAVTVTGLTLRVAIEDKKGTDVLTIADGSITKSGSTVTFTVTNVVTNQPGTYNWALRDITSGNKVLLQGVLDVVYAAELDA